MDTAAPRPDGSPARTEVVVARRGSVRVSGDLTAQGADLLRGTVESLRRSGHAVVRLDLADVRSADSAGLHDLDALEEAVAADGGELLVLDRPDGPQPASAQGRSVPTPRSVPQVRPSSTSCGRK